MYVKLTQEDKERFLDLITDFAREEREKNGDNTFLNEELEKTVQAFTLEIARREFSKLGGDREKILESAEEHIYYLINDRYKRIRDNLKHNVDLETLAPHYPELRIDGETFYLDVDTLVKNCKEEVLPLHYEAFKDDQEATDLLDALVYKVISEDPKTSSDIGYLLNNKRQQKKKGNKKRSKEVSVNYPDYSLTSVDAVSNKIWEYFPMNEVDEVNVQQKELQKKKPIITKFLVTPFDDLNEVQIKGKKEMTPFDREVHDHIATLYVEGKNEYITPNMIYQQMTGKKDAHCSKKQEEAISESIIKLMYTRVLIDAEDEAKQRGWKETKYDAPFINAKRKEVVFLNGQEVEAIKMLDTPIVFDYAQHKNQIGRFPINLLNSPIQKTGDNIVLDAYLRRRIIAMRSNPDLSRIILCDTIYKHLRLTEKFKDPASLNNKKMKVRNTVKILLDFYKKEIYKDNETFIKGYTENRIKEEKNMIESYTIRIK